MAMVSDISAPINLFEHLQLSSLGVEPDSITSLRVTFESDRFICVREGIDGQKQVAIIDLTDANSVVRYRVCADSAIMHPFQDIIALRAGRTLQIFDLTTKLQMKTHVNNDDIVFWNWISETTIGIVTESSVFHWSLTDETSPPQKIANRHPTLALASINNYCVTPDEKWFILIGTQGDFNNMSTSKGLVQLYSSERNVSQFVEGHTAAFAEIKLKGNRKPTQLFLFSVFTGAGFDLHIVELDHQEPNFQFVNKVVSVHFPHGATPTHDFPIAMHASKKHGTLYLVTKYSFVYLFDLETGARICMTRISNETVVVSAEHKATNGVIILNEKGQVLRVNIDEETVIRYISTTLKNDELAYKLAIRADLLCMDGLYMDRYQQVSSTGNLEATNPISNSTEGISCNDPVSRPPKQASFSAGILAPIIQYFDTLLEEGELDRLESLEFARAVLQQKTWKYLFGKRLGENKLTCSEELGDLVRLHDVGLALNVYNRANVPAKVASCLAETGQADMTPRGIEGIRHILLEPGDTLDGEETPKRKTNAREFGLLDRAIEQRDA